MYCNARAIRRTGLQRPSGRSRLPAWQETPIIPYMHASPDTTVPRKRLHPLQGAAIMLLLSIAGLGAWWVVQMVGASPLQPVESGTHDFGIVLIEGKDATVEHVFRLKNTTDTPLQIIKTVPSCGCTWAGVGEPHLPAGATMDLPVTLTVKESHKIDSNIKVVLEGHAPLVLWLSAEGRIRKGLRHVPDYLRLKPAHPDAVARLFVEWWEETPPPPPTFETSRLLKVDFLGWELKSRGELRLGTPDQYTAQLAIIAEGDPPLNAFVRAVMPDGQETAISINPRGSLGETRGSTPPRVPGTPEFTFDPAQVGAGEPESAPAPAPDDH